MPTVPLDLPDWREQWIFEEQLEAALDEAEIAEAASAATLESDTLRRDVLQEWERMWQAVRPEREDMRRRRAVLDERRGGVPLDLRLPIGPLPTSTAGRLVLLVVGAGTGVVAADLVGASWLVTIALVVAGLVVAWLVRAVVAVRAVLPLDDESTRAEHERAVAEFETALTRASLLPALRTVITARSTSYDPQLAIDSAPGLTEIHDPQHDVQTATSERLQDLMAGMRGGSIGISGPRGVGKSTLIRACCAGRNVALGTGAVIGALVSAPVRYEPREFVLHLLGELCQAVHKDAVGRPYVPSAPAAPGAWSDSPVARALQAAAPLLLVSALAVGAVWALEIKVPAELQWVGLLLALSAAGFASMWAERRRSRGEPLWRPRGEDDALLALRRRAEELLDEIRFQQSYSSGYSGALRLPIGVQASVSSSVQLAKRQKTLPDVVHLLHGFIADIVATQRTVIVGIDELDKMESGEVARRFLNEVKAVFGSPGCFYLVSISEDAMSGFERRGLPFRDVFDSSFDEVLRVPPLDLAAAHRVLARRVALYPKPFAALCHCLAGGLARDLIRAARGTVEVRRRQRREMSDAPALSLTDACETLLADEVASKCDAVAIAAQTLRGDRDVARLHAWIDRVRATDVTASGLRRCCEDALAVFTAHPTDVSPELVSASRRLRLELLGFLYHSATLLEFVTRHPEGRALLDGRGAGATSAADQLALARFSFVFAPEVAWELVTQFRLAHGLGALDLPGVTTSPLADGLSAPTGAARTAPPAPRW